MTINEFIDNTIRRYEELITETIEIMDEASKEGNVNVYTFYRGECMAYTTAIGYLKRQKQLLEEPDENL